jgi:hypothetical protein
MLIPFCNGSPTIPVDTDIARVTKRLGWIPHNATYEKAHQLLSALIPPKIYNRFRVNLIRLGREVRVAFVPPRSRMNGYPKSQVSKNPPSDPPIGRCPRCQALQPVPRLGCRPPPAEHQLTLNRGCFLQWRCGYTLHRMPRTNCHSAQPSQSLDLPEPPRCF